MLQLAASILFFYVLGLGGLIMTVYISRVIRQFLQEGKKKNGKDESPDSSRKR